MLLAKYKLVPIRIRKFSITKERVRRDGTLLLRMSNVNSRYKINTSVIKGNKVDLNSVDIKSISIYSFFLVSFVELDLVDCSQPLS